MEKYFSVCRSKIVADENVFIKNARILTETYHNIFDVTSFQGRVVQSWVKITQG